MTDMECPGIQCGKETNEFPENHLQKDVVYIVINSQKKVKSY